MKYYNYNIFAKKTVINWSYIMYRKNSLKSQANQPVPKHISRERKLAIYLLSCFLLLSLSACFKTTKAPIPEQGIETERSINNSLETSNTSDIDEWLMPLLSEYLKDDGPLAPPPPPAPPPKFYPSSPNVGIPDNNATGVSDTITISETDTIFNMSIDLEISHTYIGNLVILLEHVDTGTRVELLNRPISNGNCRGDDIDVTVVDGADRSLQNDCQSSTFLPFAYSYNVEYEPKEALSIFAGKEIKGDWKLTVSDKASGNTGILKSWTLRFNKWKSVSAGGFHSCGLGTDNKAYCWGSGSFGRLGTGDTNNSLIPKLVLAPIGGAITWKSISAGSFHSCGIGTDNKAYCWGDGLSGQLGTGDTNNSLIPKLVLAPISGAITWKSISAGNNHSCGIAPDNKAYCWGSGSFGRLGTGNDTTVNKPTLVIDP